MHGHPIEIRKCNRTLLLIFSFGLLALCCQSSDENPSEELAKVGNRRITVNDFIRRVELSPLPEGMDISQMEGRKVALNLLIKEKIFAMQAEKLKIQKDPTIKKKIRSIEMAAVGRELYRDEVQIQVTVDENEVREAFEKSRIRLVVRTLLTSSREEAEDWEKRLDRGTPFEELLAETANEAATPNTHCVDFNWGQFDENLENAAYAMTVGEISPVIKTGKGYSIIRLENRIRQGIQNETDFASKKNAIEKIIRRRKEAVRSGLFVHHFMKDKHVVLKRKPFSFLASELIKGIDFKGDSDKGFQPKIQILGEPELTVLQNGLASWLDTVLVEFKGGVWTVGDFLEKMALQEIPIQRESPELFRKGLMEAIRIRVRDDLLAMEGMYRKLDRRPAVRQEVNLWKDYFLYAAFKDRLKSENAGVNILPKMESKTSIRIHEEKLKTMELTSIPLLAVWNGYQRQFVVPLWPRFDELTKEEEIH